MKIEYLHEFVVLCESMNFTKAAKELFMTQPALSGHISSLEKEFGVPLLVRDHHHVRTTRYGEIFLQEAQAVIRQYDVLKRRIEHEKSGISQELRIGYLNYAYREDVRKIMNDYQEQDATATFSLYANEYREISQALYCGAIDVAFTIDCDPKLRESCDIETLGTEPLVLAISDDDPIAQRESITLEELADIPLVFPDDQSITQYAHKVNELFAESGIQPIVDGHFNDVNSRESEIMFGKKRALVMRHFARTFPESITTVPLEDANWAIDLIVAWKRTNLNAAIPRFVEAAKQHFGADA